MPRRTSNPPDAFKEFLSDLSQTQLATNTSSLEKLAILYNANVLLRAKEYDSAQALFHAIGHHPQYRYLAQFGIGMCNLKLGRVEKALEYFEHAYLECKKPFAALAVSQVLIDLGRHSEVEDWIFRFSKDLRNEREFLRKLKDQYISSLKSQLQSKINFTKGETAHV